MLLGRFTCSILLSLLVLLAACAPSSLGGRTPGVSATATPELFSLPLSLYSDPDTIRLKMLYSFRLWDQAWVDRWSLDYDADGMTVIQNDHQQVWVGQLANRYRLLAGPAEGKPEKLSVSDGLNAYQINLQTGQTETYSATSYDRAIYATSESVGDVISPHPLAGSLGYPVGGALFPIELAQRGGLYVPVDTAFMTGRTALIVDWYRQEGGARVDRFWIDVDTGVLLRWQNYGKQGGEALVSDYTVKVITYDVTFPADLFTIPPAVLPSDFIQDALGATPAPVFLPQYDPGGELYFTLVNRSDQTSHLVRLPGTCVLTGLCAAAGPEVLPSSPDANMGIPNLVWSPDGSQAVVAAASKVYTFDPAALAWSVLAEVPGVGEPIIWSPDGKWFIVRGGQSQRDLYAVSAGGTRMVNLTETLQGEGFSIPAGWLGEKFLFAFGGFPPSAYLVNPATGQLGKSSLGAPAGKGELLPSPDGNLIAIDAPGQTGVAVNLLNPDGSLARRLGSFSQSSAQLFGWSPDKRWLLFLVRTEANEEVYLARADGTDLRQIYRGWAIPTAFFSSAGKSGFVVIADDTLEGSRLFIYSLSENTYHLLAVPGLSLGDDWRAPSWRPPQP